MSWNPDRPLTSVLLYDNSFCGIIKEAFPGVEFDHSAQDYLHEKRVGITFPEGVTYGEFYRFALAGGFARSLLCFELHVQEAEKDFYLWVTEELKHLAKAGMAEATS